MTAGAPWSVKGIDPKAREVAKDLARRSGMTLGEWLNRMIIDGEPGDLVGAAEFADAMQRPPGSVHYMETPRAAAPTRIEAPEHPADEVGRVALALDRLTDRIEAAEQRSAQAITGIDESVRGALTRIENAERDHISVAARFEGVVDDLQSEQQRAAERLRRIESEAAGPRSAEAMRALEGALGKVAGHLYEGEARTRETINALEARLETRAGGAPVDPSNLVDEVVARLGQRLEAAETRTGDALRELGASFAALDGRLRTVEAGESDDGAEQRLRALAEGLSQRMEAARQEMAVKLADAADGRFDRMERKLGEMTAHVQEAEQRSAQAIERMGHEVIGIADVLNRRVQTAETRNAAAIEQVGGEVARIAATVEQKLNRADSVHAQALEKLGVEIARITEKLAERIGNAERRNALAIDDVGEQVSRVAERLNQRQERSSQDLIDRIRLSEERTTRLLEEAREKIDSRLTEQRKLTEQVAQAPRPEQPFGHSPFDGERYSFGGEAVPEAAFASAPTFASAPAGARPVAPVVFEAPAAEAPAAVPPIFQTAAFPTAPEPSPPAFAEEDFEAADGFAPIIETAPPKAPVAEPEFEPIEPAKPATDRPLSTREVIEQARAAARMAAQGPEAKKKVSPAAGASSLFSGFAAKVGEKKINKRRTGTLKTALMVSGTAAGMGVAFAGMMLLSKQPGGAPPARIAASIEGRKSDGEIRRAEADTSPGAPRASVALIPQVTPTDPAQALTAPTENLQALYDEGVRRIEAKDKGGLEPLRRAANLGHPRSQFYLAKMYEMGEGGVKKDLAEARRWTERAAESGDARAMHNLALYYFKGEGGPKNSTTAAQWFRKAADLGLVDSQFNLAQLYEGGWGVSQNPAEAYKWYLIAARAGDTTSRTRAGGLRNQLTAEAQRTAERSATGFRAQAANPSAAKVAMAAPNDDVRTAQRALSRLGYYQSPQDGVVSPGLPMAVAAYQRDQGLPTTGALDGETLSRLSAFAR